MTMWRFSHFSFFMLLYFMLCSAASRRILHEPFFPVDSTPPSQSPAPSSAPAIPFSNPADNSLFFPTSPPPPPPSPSAFASFPANISSMILPQPHKSNGISQKLLAGSLVSSFIAIVLLVLVAYIYHRRCGCKNSDSPATKTKRSKEENSNIGGSSRVYSSIFGPLRNGHGRKPGVNSGNSEFLYLGTIADSHHVDSGVLRNTNAGSSPESETSRILDSPELFPLPPLYYNATYPDEDVSSTVNDEDFYSPIGSTGATTVESGPTRVFSASVVDKAVPNSRLSSDSPAVRHLRSPECRSSASSPLSKGSNTSQQKTPAVSSPTVGSTLVLPPSPASSLEQKVDKELQASASPAKDLGKGKIVLPFLEEIGKLRTAASSCSSSASSPERGSSASVGKLSPKRGAGGINRLNTSSDGEIGRRGSYPSSNTSSLSSSPKRRSNASVRSLPGNPNIVIDPDRNFINDKVSLPSDNDCRMASETVVSSPTLSSPIVAPPAPPPPPPPPLPPSLHPPVPLKFPAESVLSSIPRNQPIEFRQPALFPPPQPFVFLGSANISPPEPLPASAETVDSSEKPKLKPLHWDKVRASSDREMVWDHLKSSSFKVNEEMIETLFIVNAPQPKPPGQFTPRIVIPNQENRVLDPKRAQNIAILLRALNVTTEEVCEALIEGNTDALGAELLESLLKMAPTKEEERRLREFKDDTPMKLGQAEKFLKALLDIPFAFKRAEAMLYIANFETEIEYLKKSFETLELACEELRNSRMFLKLLEAVLKTGNRMNVGTNRGDALAFKLDTLLKLVDVKGADGKTTLLHFVVQEIIRTEGARVADGNDDAKCRKLCLQVVAGLSSELAHVKKAAGMDSDVLTGDVSKLSKGIHDIEEGMKAVDVSSSQKFSESMRKFLKYAEEEIIKVQAQESVALSLVKEITEYFHGNSAKEEAHPFRIFMVVRDFLVILDRVCKEVGMINERTVVSSAHKFPVPVNPTLGGRHNSSSDEEKGSSSS